MSAYDSLCYSLDRCLLISAPCQSELFLHYFLYKKIYFLNNFHDFILVRLLWNVTHLCKKLCIYRPNIFKIVSFSIAKTLIYMCFVICQASLSLFLVNDSNQLFTVKNGYISEIYLQKFMKNLREDTINILLWEIEILHYLMQNWCQVNYLKTI